MIKNWIIRILSSVDQARTAESYKSHQSIIQEQKANIIKLSSYRESKEYKQSISDWSKPENIVARIRKFEEEAHACLEKANFMSKHLREYLGLPDEDPPLPDPLPKDMVGQSSSTIRAMLRQQEYEFDKDLKIWKRR